MPRTDDNSTNLTPNTAIEILKKILDQLQSSENVKKLEEARDNVGNEMLKMIQFVFPIVMQIQMDVIKEYGFAEGREGLVKFAILLRAIEREDNEVARLHSLIKAYYLTSVSVNTNHTTADMTVPSAPIEEKIVSE